MAIGDVVSEITAVGVGANLDFRPSAGVECKIVSVGSSIFVGTAPNRTPEVVVNLYDGTLESRHSEASNGVTYMKQPLWITNAHYLRLFNGANASRNLSYSGVQTK